MVHVGQGAHGLAVFRLGGALSHSARGMLSGNFRTCSEGLSGTVLSDESLAQEFSGLWALGWTEQCSTRRS